MAFLLLYLIMIRVFGWLLLLGRSEASKDAGSWCSVDERIPGDAEASGLAPGPVSSSDPGRCSVLRATGCARQCGRRHPRSPGLGTAVRRE